MAGIQPLLHGVQAMALLALGDEIPGVDQIVDDAARIRPHAEQVVVLEEAIVPIGRVGDHQRLHGGGVFLHQVADAGIGIDDDLIGQAHVAASIAPLGRQVILAIAPMAVAHGHARARVGVHHLLGRDHFQLIGVGVQAEARGRGGNGRVVALYQLERPVAGVWQRVCRALARGQGHGGHATLGALPRDTGLPGISALARRQYRVLREVHTETPSFLKRSRNTG
ncbi:hypothetical protein D3C78_1307960 [compost metagenome]